MTHRYPLLLLLAATACGGSNQRQQAPSGQASTGQPIDPAVLAEPPEAQQYHADLQVNISEMLRTPAGVLYEDKTVGTGDSLRTGQTAAVWYSLWLPSGEPIDSNIGGELFVFPVGAGEVIQGWDSGVVGMRVGGKRKLVIPYQLGYGEQGRGPIPPYATLVFDVELVEIR